MAFPAKTLKHIYTFLIGFFLGTLMVALFHRGIINRPLAARYSTDDLKITLMNVGDGKLLQNENLTPDRGDHESGTNQIINSSVNDKHYHNDDTSLAEKLYKEVRVLCWVMTSPKTLSDKGIRVKDTWGKRCNKFLFANDNFVNDTSIPTMNISVTHGRHHLTAKTMKAFDYVYEHYKDDYDWFLKADDDTYVIMENLRYLLSAHSPQERVFFGHHFVPRVAEGYFSGGAGYVVSREALRLFSLRQKNQCRSDGTEEDVDFGACMAKLGVNTGESRDRLGRIRFHCFNPNMLLFGKPPDWFDRYSKYKNRKGKEYISDYSISFHYLTSKEMALIDFFIYHLRPYGIITYPQKLNGPLPETDET